MPVEVTLKGADRLQRRLSALEPKVAAQVQRKAARETAKRIQSTAKADAPEGETGSLRRAIKVRSLRRSRKKRVGARVFVDQRFLSRAGVNYYYPAVIEFGTRKSNRIKADKYFRISAARHHKTATVLFKLAVRMGLREAAKNG